MFSKTIVSVLVLFFVSINVVTADEGCYYSPSGYIYYTPDGTYNGMKNFTYVVGPGGSRIHNSAVYCATYTSVSCRVDKSSGVTGKLVNFSMVPCPIDDQIPVLLLATGVSVLFF